MRDCNHKEISVKDNYALINQNFRTFSLCLGDKCLFEFLIDKNSNVRYPKLCNNHYRVISVQQSQKFFQDILILIKY